MKNTAIVLLSGGLDSATVLAMVVHKGFSPIALSLFYNQRHSIELERASQLAAHYKCEHVISKLDPQLFLNTALIEKNGIPIPQNGMKDQSIPVTYVPARNILFLAQALALAESHQSQNIYLGVNAIDYSGYPDCRPEFIEAFRKMANLGTKSGIEGNSIQIHTPLQYLSKKEIIEMGTELGLDYGFTSSCYQPTPRGNPCKKCESCQLRQQGFYEANITDPLLAL